MGIFGHIFCTKYVAIIIGPINMGNIDKIAKAKFVWRKIKKFFQNKSSKNFCRHVFTSNKLFL